MKLLNQASRFLLAGSFIFAAIPLAQAADTNRPPLLTIELRDGSRIVGTSLEKSLKFHSPLLGNFKLDLKDIRSVDCASSNLTTLATANGDSLNVSFAEAQFAVKTSFGKIDLPTDSIRRLTVSAMDLGPNSAGLIGFWSGNSQGKDSVSGSDAAMMDITFADGMDGQAFSFNGDTSSIRIPASQSLDVGQDDGFTVMAWIKPSDVQGLHPLLGWFVNGTWDDNDLQIWIGLRPDENGVLRVNLAGNGENPAVVSHEGALTAGVFQHIAFTYDKARSVGTLFVNGVMVAQRRFNSPVVAHTKGDLWMSYRDVRPGNWSTGRMFSGLMDNLAVYNRALSDFEIQAICQRQNHGQPLILPAASTGWQELMNN